MKRSITPTLVERVMREDDFIVSMTDLKGRITYGNRIFIEFSGYTESELIGTQHNIIRHPDMPRGVFQLLWDKIQAGSECFAYVKNMSKDGGFYWVFANVTPTFDTQGKITGYLSIRRKPKMSGIQTVSGLYAAMLEEEKRVGPAGAIAASTKMLVDVLNEKGLSYDELVLAI
ncbi:MAG TPA: aerotaxis receptor Aer [Gallionella sp.]|jgi:PAS domain S-box-containing protein|nr:PAS domain-containing protein [Gallionella sp.]OGS67001.1 MAG: aerotaxis receptor Aer [Gallionellales bacterium GWA2_54_124]OGT17221.1 MAG: aerotaxis receptor Aer [Gallionellales bacterium RIFOXYD12_FULL_53_10]HCI51770.1 aerotaxis receptor Aer [Gallionella sp.]